MGRHRFASFVIEKDCSTNSPALAGTLIIMEEQTVYSAGAIGVLTRTAQDLMMNVRKGPPIQQHRPVEHAMRIEITANVSAHNHMDFVAACEQAKETFVKVSDEYHKQAALFHEIEKAKAELEKQGG